MITPTNLSGRNANPEMLTSALFRCLNDLITRHATNLQADGSDEHTVRLAVERYRGQLLEQMATHGDHKRTCLVRVRRIALGVRGVPDVWGRSLMAQAQLSDADGCRWLASVEREAWRLRIRTTNWRRLNVTAIDDPTRDPAREVVRAGPPLLVAGR